jgi:hypothetical protein
MAGMDEGGAYPEVLATGLFIEHRFFRIITRLEGESGITYSIQYFLDDLENYHLYQAEFAPVLQTKSLLMWKEKQAAFRTLLEEV